MAADGSLAKMKTREKKYKPIACYVNSVQHVHDPIAYPWQWSWKDVSTKVQNMRHQYLLVKQKIKKSDAVIDNPMGGECTGDDDFDWLEGLTRRERRRKEDSVQESKWDERLTRKKLEWKKRMDEMLNQHRAEMNQMQTRFLHEQQNLTSQLLGIVSQWTGHTHPAALSDQTASSNHYLSQMMQNLHHVNGMVHGDDRVDGDNQDDQFIADG